MLTDNLPAPQARAARAQVPYRVHFVVTHKCNLACAHCYQAEHDSEDLSLDEVKDVLAQLAELGCLFLTLGGGEPLARRDFWEILAEARRLRFAVQLYTNGTLVTAEVAQRLRTMGVTEVSVSLHGVHAMTHDVFVRRPGAFDRVNRAIDLLEAQRIAVTVKANATALNHRELPALAARFAPRALVKLSINKHLFARDDGDTTPTVYRLTEEQERGVVREELATRSRPVVEAILQTAARAQASDDRENVPCQATRTTFAIHPNGDVSPCTQTADMPMGNVRQRRVGEIWRDSAVGDRFRALRLTTYLEALPDCGSCEFRKVCARCPALSASESGSLSGFSPQVCQSTRVYWTELRRRAAELDLPCPV